MYLLDSDVRKIESQAVRAGLSALIVQQAKLMLVGRKEWLASISGLPTDSNHEDLGASFAHWSELNDQLIFSPDHNEGKTT